MTEYYFTGRIDRIIFENSTNFYKILLLDIEETDSPYEDLEIIVTGTMADVFEGEDYQFYGHIVTHAKYGEQLQMTRYERSKPTSAGLVRYFSSDQFKGIGRKIAEKIIELYGEDTIDHILAEPEKLSQISGLSAKNRQAFVEKLRFNYGTEITLAKLAEYGIPNKLAFQIQDHYKDKTLTIIQENPYQLVEDIQGLGFTIADKIAETLGIDSDSPKRFRAALVFSLTQLSMETGDTYIEARQLLEHSLEILEKARHTELEPALVAQELSYLIQEDKVQQIDTKIFSNSLFFAEKGIHTHIRRLLDQQTRPRFSTDEINDAIAEVEKASGFSYDTIQKDAIHQALSHPLFILTGGPGTGKTTVINGIIAIYARLHDIDLNKTREDCPILLAAPTGRAARRMNELTGLASATIHRHLGLIEGQEESSRDDYLEADFIIIDEFSMVDTWLANQLFQHISSHTKVLIVGDAEQLPSVSPGQVLADLLQIPSIPSITLQKIFRQSEDSTIVTLANHIRQGELPVDFCDKKADRSYFEAHNENIPTLIERIVSAAVQSGIKPQEVQILAPMYRGQAGIDLLNATTQALLNPLKEGQIEFLQHDLHFRQGDRVIHLVNDTEANVFNGDLGYITDLLPAKYSDSKQDELTIQFDGSEVVYPRNEWYKITLAYAMSIHKSQGSEFQVVILPITRTSYRMLQRNLLYTAITRSKSKLILLGEYTSFRHAVQQAGSARNTFLKERFGMEQDTPSLNANLDSTTTETNPAPYILTEENLLTIDPMIGIYEEDIKAFFQPKDQP